jgi:hypothetical protein
MRPFCRKRAEAQCDSIRCRRAEFHAALDEIVLGFAALTPPKSRACQDRHNGKTTPHCRVANCLSRGILIAVSNGLVMTATTVIEEIEQLPPEEQSRVIQYAMELARRRQLTGKELGDLARRMVETKDPAEADRLQEEIVRGFYGDPSFSPAF